MPFDKHSPVEQRVFRVLESFVDAFSERRAPAHLDEVLRDGKYMKAKELGQKPERFIEDNLIWGTLDALGYEYIPRPYRHKTIPDFAVTNFEFDFEFSTVGEVKTLNKFEYAEEDVANYLQKDLGEYDGNGFRRSIRRRSVSWARDENIGDVTI